ncbi:homoserine kinase [Fructilactobacillus cliffordii]|uniref:Homoserine kinase n=1 Tax=Fructilactobacillus cliffordii TaxID=2940299 RepID=A0A9Q8ZPU9_9LACO|nr:homoserine kinase [Fructilactobacillus cliffordii]USS89365.1 homoserine kinase [Fructilactobacillus cliffordii]
MIKVTVPATSANLGVGYDCLGLALALRVTFQFQPADQLTITGCPEQFQNETNLVYRAFAAGCEALGKAVPTMKIAIDSPIPVSRGLWSSATCIVAGLAAAGEWFQTPFTQNELVQLATDIEGHPDNVTPAIYGGLCAGVQTDAGISVLTYPVADNLAFLAIVPDFTVSTDEARSLLPQSVSYATATHQISHSLLLVRSLMTGNLLDLQLALDDRLHEPYRKKLIANYDVVAEACDYFECSLYISGSGSTLIAITDDASTRGMLRQKLMKQLPDWKIFPIAIDTAGVQVEQV